jgi:BASS family bile acid:Na+ symporter
MLTYLIAVAVLTLMVSIGASLKRGEILANWKQVTWGGWLKLTTATFLLPPLLALLIARGFGLGPAETAGLILVAVAPGAPLLSRNIAARGFDLQLAASYQIWAALLVPVMIPLTVAAAAKLYHRDIWISPELLLGQIVRQQFLPLAAGMLLAHVAPDPIMQKLRRFLAMAGNLLLVVALLVIAYALGPRLQEITAPGALATVLLAAGSIAAIRVLRPGDRRTADTLALCNANRNVGLAVLLAGQQLRNRNVVPILLCYVLASLFAMSVYVFAVRRSARRASSLVQ